MRGREMRGFLDAAGWEGIVPVPLAGDASFRRYYRLCGRGRRAVLMDAPPPQENVAPYITVSGLLRELGLSAPEIFAEDRMRGFLLIEDFGDDTYTRLLDRGADEGELYALAVDTLVELQRAVEIRRVRGLPVPPYDAARLLAEAALLVDWYMPAALGALLSQDAREEYFDIWRSILPQAALLGGTLVLRDYHVDNLMVLRGRSGCGAAVCSISRTLCRGRPAMISYRCSRTPAAMSEPSCGAPMTERYLAAFPRLDRAAFLRSAAILAAQRNCKILGIFTRLWKRDGKPGYLAHIPRVWRLLEQDLGHPAWRRSRTGSAVICRPPPGARPTREPRRDRAAALGHGARSRVRDSAAAD